MHGVKLLLLVLSLFAAGYGVPSQANQTGISEAVAGQRVIYVSSDQDHLATKDKLIRRQIAEIAGKYEVLDIEAEYYKGFLIAAKIWVKVNYR